MVRIKRIGVLSLAVFEAILMAIIGLVAGTIYAIIQVSIVGGIGYLNIILFPIIYFILGFISGAIGALLYNLIAKLVGGIDIELEK